MEVNNGCVVVERKTACAQRMVGEERQTSVSATRSARLREAARPDQEEALEPAQHVHVHYSSTTARANASSSTHIHLHCPRLIAVLP